MTSAIETLKTWITESDNIVFFGGAVLFIDPHPVDCYL